MSSIGWSVGAQVHGVRNPILRSAFTPQQSFEPLSDSVCRLTEHDRLLAGRTRALTTLSLLLALGVRLVTALVFLETGGRGLLAGDGSLDGVCGSLHFCVFFGCLSRKDHYWEWSIEQKEKGVGVVFREQRRGEASERACDKLAASSSALRLFLTSFAQSLARSVKDVDSTLQVYRKTYREDNTAMSVVTRRRKRKNVESKNQLFT